MIYTVFLITLNSFFVVAAAPFLWYYFQFGGIFLYMTVILGLSLISWRIFGGYYFLVLLVTGVMIIPVLTNLGTIISFHDHLMFLVAMVVSVMGYVFLCLLAWKLNQYSLKSNQMMEILSIVMSVFFIVLMGFPLPSFLNEMEELQSSRMSVKAMPHEWCWLYECPDFSEVSLNSFMASENSFSGDYRFFEVDGSLSFFSGVGPFSFKMSLYELLSLIILECDCASPEKSGCEGSETGNKACSSGGVPPANELSGAKEEAGSNTEFNSTDFPVPTESGVAPSAEDQSQACGVSQNLEYSLTTSDVLGYLTSNHSEGAGVSSDTGVLDPLSYLSKYHSEAGSNGDFTVPAESGVGPTPGGYPSNQHFEGGGDSLKPSD